MTAPILTLAEVQALSGFTEGPWRVAHTAGQGGIDSHKVYADTLPGYSHPRCVGEANRRFAILADQQLIAAAPALHATCLHLFAEVARLTAELEKPVMLAWDGGYTEYRRSTDGHARVTAPDVAKQDCGWEVWRRGVRIAAGPETGPVGKRAADLAALPFYRLVGGVFGEVSDG